MSSRIKERVRTAVVDRSDEARASNLEALLAGSGSREEILEGAAASYRTGDLSAGGLAGLDHMLAGLAPLDAPQGTRLADGPGEAVSPAVRSSLEAVFGQPLDRIRVHADAEGAAVARGLGAHAAASGRDIFLARPELATDLPLMGHEVAHVMAGTQAVALKKDPKARRGAQEAQKPAGSGRVAGPRFRNECDDGRVGQEGEIELLLAGPDQANEAIAFGNDGKPLKPTFLEKIAPYMKKEYRDPTVPLDVGHALPGLMCQDGREDPLAGLDEAVGDVFRPDEGARDAKDLLAKLDDDDRAYLRSDAGLALLDRLADLPEYHGLARFRAAWVATESERAADKMEADEKSQPWKDLFGDKIGGQIYQSIVGATGPDKLDDAAAEAVAGQVDSYIQKQIAAIAERAKTDATYTKEQAAQDTSEWKALQAMMKDFVPAFVKDMMAGTFVKNVEEGAQQLALHPELYMVLALALVSPVSTSVPGAEGTSTPIELLAGLPIDCSKLSFEVLKSKDASRDLTIGGDVGKHSVNGVLDDPGSVSLNSLNAKGSYRFGSADTRSLSLAGDATWNLDPDAASTDLKKSSALYGKGSLTWQDKKQGTLLGVDGAYDGKGVSSLSAKQQWAGETDNIQFGEKYLRNDATGGYSLSANQSILNRKDPKNQLHLTEGLTFGKDGSLSALNLSQKFQDKDNTSTLTEGFEQTDAGFKATFGLQSQYEKFDYYFKTEMGDAGTKAGFGMTAKPNKTTAFDVKMACDLLGPTFLTSLSTSLQIGDPEKFVQTYVSYQRSNKPELTVDEFTTAFRKSFGKLSLSGGANLKMTNGKTTSFNASGGALWKGGKDGKSGLYGVADYDRTAGAGGMNDLTLGAGYWRNGVGIGPQVQVGDHAPVWGVGVRTDLDFLGKKRH